MNSKRKNCSNTRVSPETRDPEIITSDERIYNNAHFMHAVTTHIGNLIRVQTQNGSVFEGIFRTFSSEFEVVLEMAHKVDTKSPAKIPAETVIEKLIFKPHVIIIIEVKDVDLEYATKDVFQIDPEISKFDGKIGERDLDPWISSDSNDDDYYLDDTTVKGWDVNDMFKINEEIYGVQSTFDYAMSSYTTQLQRRDSKGYEDVEARAVEIANEIENNLTSKLRADFENFFGEEEKFAAVVRPSGKSKNIGKGNRSLCVQLNDALAKRKNNQTGKLRKTIETPSVATKSAFTDELFYTDYNHYHHAVSANVTEMSAPFYSLQLSINNEQQQSVVQSPVTNANNNNEQRNSIMQSSLPTANYNNEQRQSVVQSPLPTVNLQTVDNNVNFTSTTRYRREQRIQRRVDSPLFMKPQRQATNISLRSRRVNYNTSNNSRSQKTLYYVPASQRCNTPPPFGRVSIDLDSLSRTPLFPSENIFSVNQADMPPLSHQQHLHGGLHNLLSVPLFPGVTSNAVTPQASPAAICSAPASVPSHSLLKSNCVMDQKNSRRCNNQNMNKSTANHTPRPARVKDEQQKIRDLKKFSSAFKLVPQYSNEDQKMVQPQNKSKAKISAPTTKEQSLPDAEVTLKKSNLNPNAKVFVYNVNSTTNTTRPQSTPTPPRVRTPQMTNYRLSPDKPKVAAKYPASRDQLRQQSDIATMNRTARSRNVSTDMSLTPYMAPAVTSQTPLAPMHTQFLTPYSTQCHLSSQSFQRVVGLVTQQNSETMSFISTSNYCHDSRTAQASNIQYMSPTCMTAPYRYLYPPNMVIFPAQMGGQTYQGYSAGHNTGNRYHTLQPPESCYSQLPPPPPPQMPYPLVSPPPHLFQTPPPLGPNNQRMMTAQGTVQQYSHRQEVSNQQSHHVRVSKKQSMTRYQRQ